MRTDEGNEPATDLNVLDLNLLIALDALLREQSVTRAAGRLLRSQPALSGSLQRLRRQFDDELLVRVGNRYELTPLAAQLKTRVAVLLADVGRLYETRSTFDSARSTREFTIAVSDYGQLLLGRAIAAELESAAPHARLRFRPLNDELIATAATAVRNVDGFVLPVGLIEGIPHFKAYEDRWVLLVDIDNPKVGEQVTLDELSELEWVTAFHREDSPVPPVRQLQLLGVDMRVRVVVEGFVPLPLYVQGTDSIAVIQEGLARQIAPAERFRFLECPFDVVPLAESFWWHPSLQNDPGHAWFRELIGQAGQRIEKKLLEINSSSNN